MPTAAVRLEFAESIIAAIEAGEEVSGALIVESEIQQAVTYVPSQSRNP